MPKTLQMLDGRHPRHGTASVLESAIELRTAMYKERERLRIDM